MIKFLDARERLSVQLHPDDSMAVGDSGKNEAWVVLDAGDEVGFALVLFNLSYLMEGSRNLSQAEEYLRAGEFDYTIIRPGGLSNGPMTNTAELTADAESFSYMGRKDLAQLVVQSLGDASTIGKTYTAYDPNRLHLWNLFLD